MEYVYHKILQSCGSLEHKYRRTEQQCGRRDHIGTTLHLDMGCLGIESAAALGCFIWIWGAWESSLQLHLDMGCLGWLIWLGLVLA